MKILRISIRNIASLGGDHTVDFTKAPLANAGLFSISGPTGAGKSTILDALCLALYSETPRMAAVQGAAAVTDQGKEVQQRDVRNLLRRGCGEGYAEAAFVGVDGNLYTARWKIWRARNRADGALQAVQHALFLGNLAPGGEGEVFASGRAGEVREAIAEKVGLSFDQFRRAVLLAQGDFATFLKAKDGERAEILQALTGTERFQQISLAVFERTKREEALVEAVRLRMGSNVPLDPEARAAAEKALFDAESFKAGLSAQLEQREVQQRWFADEARLKKVAVDSSLVVRRYEAEVLSSRDMERELAWVQLASMEARPKRAAELTAERELEAATKQRADIAARVAVLGEDFKNVSERFTLAKAAREAALMKQQGAAESLAKARSLDGELVPLSDAAALAEREFAVAEDQVKKVEETLLDLNTALGYLESRKREAQEHLDKLQSYGAFARDIEFWLEKFNVERRALSKKDTAEAGLLKAAAGASKWAALHAAAAAKVPSLQRQAEEAKALHLNASKVAEGFNAVELLAQRRRATERVEALKDLRQKVELHSRLLGEKAAHEELLNAAALQLQQDVLKQQSLLEVEVPRARAEARGAEESLRLAEAAVSEQALLLRATLRAGEGCPVCGSVEHPNALGQHTPEEAALSALRFHLSSKGDQVQRLMADLSGIESLLLERKRQINWRESELAKVVEGLTELGQYAPPGPEIAEVWRMCGEQRESALKHGLAEATASLNAIEENDGRRVAAERTAKDLFADYEIKRDALLKAEEVEGEAKGIAAGAALAHENAGREAATARSEHAAAFAALSPVLDSVHWRGAATEASAGQVPAGQVPAGRRDEFERGARDWLAAERLLLEVCQLEASKRAQAPSVNKAADEAREELNLRRKNRANAGGLWSAQKAARAAILEGRPVDECEAELAAAVRAASLAAEKCGEDFAKAEKDLGIQREILEELESRVSKLGEACVRGRSGMDEWLAAFSAREGRELSRAELDGWLARGADWMQHVKEHLEKAAQSLANARGAESLSLKQLEDHLAKKPTADDFEIVRSEAIRLGQEIEAATKESDSKRAVILSDDERAIRAGEFREELTLRERQAHPWHKLNSLIGSSDGTKFRNIAQQWTLDILLNHANSQLESLSGRYRLERLRDSLNLMVIDREMDGQQRSVHSLSGGESFLVSLGLALGLASLTSSRLLIESLFIDEGFGSLDAETLRAALNALSHLESQGRKVGVISHVSELVDAIPVQVRVVRSGSGASKIVV